MPLPPFDSVIVGIAAYVYHYPVSPTSHPKAWQYARIALMDAMGCAIEAISKSEDCRAMFGPVVPGTVTPNGFKLPGTSHQLDPLKGAFDMGTAIRFLDHNDAIAGADWGHPSDNLGAILAVMDWLGRSSANGKLEHHGPALTIDTLLQATIKSYEIQGCFLLRNAFNAHGLDHVILVKLASTAVVSWLLGLTEQQCHAAISHVWMDGQPLRVYRSGVNTIPRKGWAAGDACMKAVHLSLLTRAGQPGSPTVLTVPRWGFYATSFGNKEFEFPKKYGTWVIEHIFFKLMPVEGHGVSAAEAALIHSATLRARGFNPIQNVAKVEIRTNAAADLIINKKGPLSNAADRDHCMQYIVALVLLKGDIPAAQDFQDNSPWATSPELAALRKKIDIRPDEQLTRDYMDLEKRSLAAGITIYLNDGSSLNEVLIEFPVGHVQSPKTLASLEQKYKRNMGLMFSEAEMARARKAVENNGDMPVSDFLDMFTRETPILVKL
uniref:Putative 2-methylcitrate dehydratase n=1 Tax=Diffractella curvata TaxID=2819868 RepID=A0A7R6TID0_9PEZI|nr:ZopL5 [Diffractella curvata]BBU42021.1 putative 2-methylcitrate dehydratase [Diffractella curvata]